MGGHSKPRLGMPLTPRERDILWRIHSGKMLKVVAGELGVSQSTIATAVMRIKAKLGLRYMRELLAYGILHESGVELSELRAQVASLEAYRFAMQKEIAIVCARLGESQERVKQLERHIGMMPVKDPASTHLMADS